MNHFESSGINLIWTKKLVLLYYKNYNTNLKSYQASLLFPVVIDD
jgi:hypothetical protein